MEKIKVLIDEQKLNKRIREIAEQISNEYKDEEIVLVCILKGAVYFTIELSKNIKNDSVILDFMKVSSYGNNTETTGNVDLKIDLSTNIENKNVIIVEDILDTGYTLNYLYDYLKSKNPKTLKICVLLDKKERRKKSIDVDYTGFEIENKFVVGYGLDYEDKLRNLPYVGYIEWWERNNVTLILERVEGIEPSQPGRKHGILPLNYTRKYIDKLKISWYNISRK